MVAGPGAAVVILFVFGIAGTLVVAALVGAAVAVVGAVELVLALDEVVTVVVGGGEGVPCALVVVLGGCGGDEEGVPGVGIDVVVFVFNRTGTIKWKYLRM